MDHIMIDIETFSLSTNAYILAIGAVDIQSKKNSFCAFVSSEGQEDRDIDPQTVQWWMDQKPDIKRAVLCSEQITIKEALNGLSMWLGDGTPWIWANHPQFDIEVLKNAANGLGVKIPWQYWQIKDFSTVKTLWEEKKQEKYIWKNDATHHPLTDVRDQAAALKEMLADLGWSM